jgi:hypothetical protein
MFKKLIMFSVFCLMVAQLSAQENEISSEASQNGRYQISAVRDRGVESVFLLDTRNGDVWRNLESAWGGYRSWEKLPSFQEQQQIDSSN